LKYEEYERNTQAINSVIIYRQVCCLANIVRAMASSRLRRVQRIMHRGDTKNTHKILVRKPEVKRNTCETWAYMRVFFNMELTVHGAWRWSGFSWLRVTIKWRPTVKMGSKNGKGFNEYLSNYKLVKEDFAPWGC
jgi:hypothetical protein